MRGAVVNTRAAALGICLLMAAGRSLAADLPLCSAEHLAALAPDHDEATAHRPVAMPTVDYPFGTQRRDWVFNLRLRIDEAGRVACYTLPAESASTEIIDDNRRAALAQLADKTYTPFLKYGKPVAAVVNEYLPEQELPESDVPMPSVPLTDVEITLERTSCFGTCPDYEITIRGDGRVSYKGESWVDVRGAHSYRVPTEVVAKLVDSLRARGIWSMRPKFDSGISDVATYHLTVRLGNETHEITDYGGRGAGMPIAVSEFQDEVDAAARSANWVHLSLESVEDLRKSGFKFYSRAGADMLARAIANEDTLYDAAILRLIELGAPIDGKAENAHFSDEPQASTLENALLRRRELLIGPLLARGALRTQGAVDQKKMDRAFLAAISSARIGPVQQIWNAGGKRRPALHFTSVVSDDDVKGKTVPVTLALGSGTSPGKPWEGLQIMTWLATLGCDLEATRADGASLLHVAARADDVEAVRYLLAHGLSATTLDNDELPPFAETESEDVALVLLAAGMDRSPDTWAGKSVRVYAAKRGWDHVAAWLDAHGD